MLKIRLAKYGKRNYPIFRIVALEKGFKNSGKVHEVLGFWNPKTKEVKIDKERLSYWISKGGVLSKTISKLLG